MSYACIVPIGILAFPVLIEGKTGYGAVTRSRRYAASYGIGTSFRTGILTRTGIGSLTGYATGFGIERKDAGGSASGTGTLTGSASGYYCSSALF